MRRAGLMAAALALAWAGPGQATVVYDCGVTRGVAVRAVLSSDRRSVQVTGTHLESGRSRSVRLTSSGGENRFALSQPPVWFSRHGARGATIGEGVTGSSVTCMAISGAEQVLVAPDIPSDRPVSSDVPRRATAPLPRPDRLQAQTGLSPGSGSAPPQ